MENKDTFEQLKYSLTLLLDELDIANSTDTKNLRDHFRWFLGQFCHLEDSEQTQLIEQFESQDGGKCLCKYIDIVSDQVMDNEYDLNLCKILLELLETITCKSLVTCKQVIESGAILKIWSMLKVIDQSYREREMHEMVAESAVGIISNCTLWEDDSLVLLKEAAHILKKYIDPDYNSQKMVLTALLACAHIYKDTEVTSMGLSEDIISNISDMQGTLYCQFQQRPGRLVYEATNAGEGTTVLDIERHLLPIIAWTCKNKEIAPSIVGQGMVKYLSRFLHVNDIQKLFSMLIDEGYVYIITAERLFMKHLYTLYTSGNEDNAVIAEELRDKIQRAFKAFTEQCSPAEKDDITREFTIMCMQSDSLQELKFILDGLYKPLARHVITLSAPSYNNCSFVTEFAMRGSLEILTYLIEEGYVELEQYYCFSVPASRNNSFVTPLWLAAYYNLLTIASCLIAKGASVNGTSNLHSTPILAASSKGNTEMVQLLAKHGGEVNIANTDGDTPLMFAVKNCDLTEYLVATGVNVNHQNNNGYTALLKAVQDNYSDSLIYLMEQGADPTLATKHGYDAISCCAMYGKDQLFTYMYDNIDLDEARQIELLELRGAAQIRWHSGWYDNHNAYKCWKQAVDIRITQNIQNQESVQNPLFPHASKATTEFALEKLKYSYDDAIINGILIIYEQFGPTTYTIEYLIDYAELFAKNENYQYALTVIAYMLKMWSDSTMEIIMNNFHSIIKILHDIVDAVGAEREPDQLNNQLLTIFSTMLNICDSLTNCIKSKPITRKLHDDYIVMLMVLLHGVTLLCAIPYSGKGNALLNSLVQKKLEDYNGRNLLQLACTDELKSISTGDDKYYGAYIGYFPSFLAVQGLIKHGEFIDHLDHNHNSALHTCKLFYDFYINDTNAEEDIKEITQIVTYLVEQNAHLDIYNKDGLSCLEFVTSELDINVDSVFPLTCMAAIAIIEHGISYEHILPEVLVHFVDIH